MTKLKTILFDLDGTLLDTEPDFTSILNKLLQHHDRELIQAEHVRETVSNGARALIKLGFNIDESQPQFQQYFNEFLELYQEKIHQTESRLFDGTESLLNKVHSENLLWGIVTNKPSHFTLPLIEKFPALHTCAISVCPDHLKQAKPDPEGILLACKKLGCSPEQTIYIGDHSRDIEAGRNANTKTIAASWGYLNAESPIEQWQADKIIASPSEVQHYLFNSPLK